MKRANEKDDDRLKLRDKINRLTDESKRQIRAVYLAVVIVSSTLYALLFVLNLWEFYKFPIFLLLLLFFLWLLIVNPVANSILNLPLTGFEKRRKYLSNASVLVGDVLVIACMLIANSIFNWGITYTSILPPLFVAIVITALFDGYILLQINKAERLNMNSD